ncbi:hypothetical protein [Streptomyces sp. NPDC004050]
MATAFLLKDRLFPPAFTLADWAREVKTVCDKDYASTLSAIHRSNTCMDAFLSAVSEIDKPSERRWKELQVIMHAAANDLEVLAGEERKLKRRFEKIKRPEERRQEVEEFIEKVNQLSRLDVAYALEIHDVANGSLDEGNKTHEQYTEERYKLLGRIRQLLKALGVEQCHP